MHDTPSRPERWAARRRENAVRLVEGRLARLLWPLLVAEGVVVVALGLAVWHAKHADAVDGRVATALYAPPGSVLRAAAGLLTLLGAPGVAVVGALAVAVWAWWRFRDPLLAAFCPASVFAAGASESGLKKLVARARPTTALIAHERSYSFPSGHATAAAALAFSAVLLVVAAGLAWRRVAVIVGVVYSVTVSLTRLVIGVHYLSDVVAATALAGGVVLAVAWLVSRGSSVRSTVRS